MVAQRIQWDDPRPTPLRYSHLLPAAAAAPRFTLSPISPECFTMRGIFGDTRYLLPEERTIRAVRGYCETKRRTITPQRPYFRRGGMHTRYRLG